MYKSFNEKEIRKNNLCINKTMIEDYVDYIDVKKITVKHYKNGLLQFYKYLEKRERLSPVRNDVLKYKDWLTRRGYTANTKRYYLRVVKSFFEWTDECGLYPNIAKGVKLNTVKRDRSKKQGFLKNEIHNILERIDTTCEIGARDYVMILLCVTCGLRIIELQRANVGDIQTLKGMKILFIQGKGQEDKDIYVKLVKPVEDAIDNYLAFRKIIRKRDPLFISTEKTAGKTYKYKRLYVQSISRIIKNRLIDAGFGNKQYSAHSLRHTSITMLFESCHDLYRVQKHARHTDLSTTEIYIHSFNKENDTSEQDIYDTIFN